MIFFIANDDSFTYNLVQAMQALGADVLVAGNDEVSPEDIRRVQPTGLVLGPGAGTPGEAGRCVRLVRALAGTVPMFGVGLGHQCIAVAFGAVLRPEREPHHGHVDTVEHDGQGLFAGLHLPFVATRYDSAVVGSAPWPPDLHVTARFACGAVAGLRHTGWIIEGVQFDPASVLTVNGQHIVQNFLALAANGRAA